MSHIRQGFIRHSFDLDLETPNTVKFNVHIRLDKLKLFAGNYGVELSSKKISRFTHDTLKLVTFVAIEADSTFEV